MDSFLEKALSLYSGIFQQIVLSHPPILRSIGANSALLNCFGNKVVRDVSNRRVQLDEAATVAVIQGFVDACGLQVADSVTNEKGRTIITLVSPQMAAPDDAHAAALARLKALARGQKLETAPAVPSATA